MAASTEERIRAIIALELDIRPDQVPADAVLVADLGIGILSRVAIEVEIEDAFRIEFADGELDWHGLSRPPARLIDIITLVETKRLSKAAAALGGR